MAKKSPKSEAIPLGTPTTRGRKPKATDSVKRVGKSLQFPTSSELRARAEQEDAPETILPEEQNSALLPADVPVTSPSVDSNLNSSTEDTHMTVTLTRHIGKGKAINFKIAGVQGFVRFPNKAFTEVPNTLTVEGDGFVEPKAAKAKVNYATTEERLAAMREGAKRAAAARAAMSPAERVEAARARVQKTLDKLNKAAAKLAPHPQTVGA
jgi:hypothetical protein